MSEQKVIEMAPGIAPLQTKSKGVLTLGILTFLFLFAGVGGWLYFSNIQGAIIASGQVTVSGKPKTIQHLDGGIVAEIPVQNGDLVKEGDVILRLDESLLMTNYDIYKNRFREAVSRRDRLRAEQNNQESIRWNNAAFKTLGFKPTEEFRSGQRKIFSARKATGSGQILQLRQKVNQFGNQIDGLEALRRSKINQLSILKKELTGLKTLQKEGYASDNRVLAIERQIQDLVGLRAEHTAEIARVRNSVAETKLQILQIRREFDQSVITELREVELSIKDLEQQIIATDQQLKRIDIKAPVSGIIHELSIFTIGGVVGPGAPVMQIIPQGQTMEFIVNLEPQFIDSVFVGQEASVLFSAFNTHTTPQLNGQVALISADTVVNEEAGVSFYKVKISVSDKELARLGGLELVPGMPVEVFMTTKNRSPFNYLVKPLTDNVKRAFREE